MQFLVESSPHHTLLMVEKSGTR